MPGRSPNGLRLLCDVAGAAGRPSPEDALAEIAVRAGTALAIEGLRFTREPDGARVAVPVPVGGECVGYLAGDREEPLSGEDARTLAAVGQVAGVVLGRALLERELADTVAELERVDRLQDEFVAVASHELRGPIAVVRGIAATLHARHDTLDEEQRRRLRAMLDEQSEQLCELVGQLLDLSRLDAGGLAVEAKPFRPHRVVEAMLSRVAAGHEDDVDVAIDPARELFSDRPAFERVVGNLIANALEYGAPPVVVRGGGNGEGFRVAVEDRGPGVESEFVPVLFDRFTRSDAARRNAASGAGLGLAIARRYARELGGDLHYEPADPHGACFVLTLPPDGRDAPVRP